MEPSGNRMDVLVLIKGSECPTFGGIHTEIPPFRDTGVPRDPFRDTGEEFRS